MKENSTVTKTLLLAQTNKQQKNNERKQHRNKTLLIAQTNKQQNKQKVTKENSTGTKHRWKRAECDHVEKNVVNQKRREKKREAES
jgi:hypothetical protein